MAILAPRQVVLPAPRTVALPLFRARVRPGHWESGRGFMLLACGAGACAAVAYIAGCAAMTQASRHQVAVRGQIRAAQAERHIIHGKVVDLGRESLIWDWAARHGMVLASGALVYVARQEPSPPILDEGREE